MKDLMEVIGLLVILLWVLPGVFIWGYYTGRRERRIRRPDITQPRR